MIDPAHRDLSIGKQCRLLSISRSSFYYKPKGETGLNLGLMRKIDRQMAAVNVSSTDSISSALAEVVSG